MSFLGKLVGKITGAESAARGAQQASQTQAQSAQAGIDEQRRQFDALQKVLNPWVTAGSTALGAQQNLIGLGGADAQQQALSALQQSPEFTTLLQQGENAMLQNASATGGLRGGNTQSALMQFRPELLSQLINQQFQRYGGLSSTGQNAAVGVGNAGMQTGANIGNLLQQQGAALAGGQVAAGSSARAGFNDLLGLGGAFAGLGGLGGIKKLF